MNIPTERRKQKRYKPTNGVYVSVDTTGVEMAQIWDISMNGISFDHIDCKNWEKQKFNLTVKIPAEGLRMTDLPYKKIFQITKHGKKSNKCCVQLGKLSLLQKRQMKYIITNFTSPEV